MATFDAQIIQAEPSVESGDADVLAQIVQEVGAPEVADSSVQAQIIVGEGGLATSSVLATADNSVKCDTNPFPAPPGEQKEAQFNESFAFPFRFKADGDIVKSRDEQAIEDNMRSAIMIMKYGVPLRPSIGSFVPILPFDPKDISTREQIIEEARDAVAVGEDRAILDENARFVGDPESNEISMVIPYRLKNTARDWRNFRLADPDFKTTG